MCGLVAFTTLTLALQLISPNLVSSLRCLEMVAAFLVQSLITGATPSLLSSAGGLLVILGWRCHRNFAKVFTISAPCRAFVESVFIL